LKEKPRKKESPKKSGQRHYQQLEKPSNKNRYYDVLGLIIILLLGTIIYSNSHKCSFHFDDLPIIINNDRIWWLNNTGHWWWWKITSRPVSTFTLALNYHFQQLDVTWYHIVNLFIHLVNACLVWWLTLLIFSSHALKDNPISKHKKVLAFFTALLFVSHPLATQSVTYIIQRQNLMAAMFYLLSLALYIKARLSGRTSKFTHWLFAGSLISAFMAVFSKENAFTLPFAIVLVEIFFLQTKKFSVNFKDYRVILLIAVFLSFIIIYFLKFPLSIFDPIPPSQSRGSIYTITSLNYLFTQFSVIIKYIQLLILPINQNIDYDFPISNSFFEIRALLSFLLLLSLIILAIFLFKKHRIFSFGIFWFFLTLSIESSFIPINDVIFEHRTYLPSFGFFIILSTGIFMLLWNKYKYLAITFFLIIIATNSFFTYERNKIWKDEFTLWNDAASKSPKKARPYLNRGIFYDNHGQRNKAIADYSRTIEIDSTYALAYSNRGAIYGETGQYDKAIADFSKAIKFEPNNSFAVWNRGITYSLLQQWDKAIVDFSKSIEINPYTYDPYFNRGVAYGSLEQWDKAVADYSKAIEINQGHFKAYNNRGIIYYYRGQWDKAIADYTKALEINPNFADAYKNREEVYRIVNSGKNQ